MLRELGEFAHRHVVLRIVQPGRIGEIRLRQPELPGALVHHVGERQFAAGDAFGERDAGVVAGLDHHAVQQVAHADAAVERREHGRAAGGRAALAPGVLADRHLVFVLELALGDRVQHHLGGHQLGHAGRRIDLVGVALEQDGAGVGVDQDRVRRRGLEPVIFLRRRRLRVCRERKAAHREGGCVDDRSRHKTKGHVGSAQPQMYRLGAELAKPFGQIKGFRSSFVSVRSGPRQAHFGRFSGNPRLSRGRGRS